MTHVVSGPLAQQAAIRRLSEQTARMGSEVEQLRTSARIFQHSKCTACTAALDLPAVHFLCMHSFHTRCLGEDQADCPRCAPCPPHE